MLTECREKLYPGKKGAATICVPKYMIGIAADASRQRLVRDRLKSLVCSALISDAGKRFMLRSRNQVGGFQSYDPESFVVLFYQRQCSNCCLPRILMTVNGRATRGDPRDVPKRFHALLRSRCWHRDACPALQRRVELSGKDDLGAWTLR